ncbi:MAG: hypothetical protein RMJ83_05090 [Armatimonadota bacterium]|nr:hypothetical protein [Armatimonadota bacterium]
MQELRMLGLLGASLPVLVATTAVASMLAGCGGAGNVVSAPPNNPPSTPPSDLQGLLSGLLNLTSPFPYNPMFDPQSPFPLPQQQGSCPRLINNPDGSITLDFGSGCSPVPNAPVYSGSVTIRQQSATTSVFFQSFNAGGSSVISGSFTYTRSGPSSDSLSVSGEFIATPVGGSSCVVRYGFSGTLTPTSNGYTVSGEGSQTIESGASQARYNIVISALTGSQGCRYPISGSARITPVDAEGNPVGNTLTVTFSSPCGTAQVQVGGNAYSVNLQDLPLYNLCTLVQQ